MSEIRNRNAIKSFRVRATQPGVDGSLEGYWNIKKLKDNDVGILIKRVEFEVGANCRGWPHATDLNFQMGVSYGMKGDSPSYGIREPRCIAYQQLNISGVAAATTDILINPFFSWDAPPGLYIMADRLFYTVDSISTGIINDAEFRVFYTEQQFSELGAVQFLLAQP